MSKIYPFYTLFFCLLIWACSGDSPNSPPNKDKPTFGQKPSKKEPTKAVPSESVPPEQLAKAKELIAAKHELPDGKAIFKRNCASCHGFKGNLKSNGSKDLTISTISLEESIAQIYFGKGLMLPYSKLLSDAEIVAVAKYSETLRN